MDLKIKDVAELLNVSQSTIRRWINDTKIPFYKIDDQYRFSRMEIEDWVLHEKSGASPFNQAADEDDKAVPGNKHFSLYRAIHKGGVLTKVPGNDKVTVIRNAMKTIAKELNLDAEVLIDMLLDREKLQPTALNNSIGIPHTRDSFLNSHHDRVVVAFPNKPIEDYGALDGKPVQVLFFLFACDDKRHLHLLAKIAHLSGQSASHKLLLSKPNKAQLLSYIKSWESGLVKG